MGFKQSWVLSQIVWHIPTHPPPKEFGEHFGEHLTSLNWHPKELINPDPLPQNTSHFCRKSDQSQSHSYHLRNLVGSFFSRSHPWTIAINQLLKNGLNRPIIAASSWLICSWTWPVFTTQVFYLTSWCTPLPSIQHWSVKSQVYQRPHDTKRFTKHYDNVWKLLLI